MSKYTKALFVFFSLIAMAMIGYFVFWGPQKNGESFPVCTCPAMIDLGPKEHGVSALAHFAIRNDGGRELIVDQFRTSCGCAAVERETEGKGVRVESVHIPPGVSVDLYVRVSVGGPIGGKIWVQVFYATNDSNHPFGQIDITVPLVLGGIYSSPNAVLFGAVPVGTSAVQTVELCDAGAFSRQVEKAYSLYPERFKVRLIPVQETEIVPPIGSQKLVVARLEITAMTQFSGPLEGEIQVELKNDKRNPCRIPVTGRVVSPVECWPSTITLPRRIGKRAEYFGESLIRSRDESPIEVRILSSHSWLKVGLLEVPNQQDQRIVSVEAKAPTPPERSGTAESIRLSVRSGNGPEEFVVLPIKIAEESP